MTAEKARELPTSARVGNPSAASANGCPTAPDSGSRSGPPAGRPTACARAPRTAATMARSVTIPYRSGPWDTVLNRIAAFASRRLIQPFRWRQRRPLCLPAPAPRRGKPFFGAIIAALGRVTCRHHPGSRPEPNPLSRFLLSAKFGQRIAGGVPCVLVAASCWDELPSGRRTLLRAARRWRETVATRGSAKQGRHSYGYRRHCYVQVV